MQALVEKEKEKGGGGKKPTSRLGCEKID